MCNLTVYKKKKKKNCLFQIKGPRGANIIRKRNKQTTSMQQYFTERKSYLIDRKLQYYDIQ